MVMRLTDSPWRVIHVADRHFPIIHGDVWQVVFENGRRWRRGLRGRRSRLRIRRGEFREQSNGTQEGVSTCNHGCDYSS